MTLQYVINMSEWIFNKNFKTFTVLIGLGFVFIIFYTYNLDWQDSDRIYIGRSFLIKSSKCSIINLDPFNAEALRYHKPKNYITCRNLDLLTYVVKNSTHATLHINNTLLEAYSKNVTNCCYSTVVKKYGKSDNKIEISQCLRFEDSVELTHDTVMIKCRDNNTNSLVYENTHRVVWTNEQIKEKMSRKNPNLTSILLVGIDSVSRLNLIRQMPKTFKAIQKHGFSPLQGYNKVGDNTFPNLMAILIGNRLESYCKPKTYGGLDSCPILWYDFRDNGYITAYAEDDPSIGTFNYAKKGFTKSPTDYYFRGYMLASDKMKLKQFDRINYCVGPETSGEKILNLIRDFETTFLDYPTFGHFWMNTFSHSDLNMPSTFDDKMTEFFQDLQDYGVYNKSIVIFISDHGMRFGGIRKTHTGWLEGRMPFIYFSFPPFFKEQYSNLYQNFRNNEFKLTSPYDIHMTLQQILSLSTNYTIHQAMDCPSCQSVLEEIPRERSCKEAGIPEEYCSCTNYESITPDQETDTKIKKFLTKSLKNVTDRDPKCTTYEINKILQTEKSMKLPNSQKEFYIVRFETKPTANFEATIENDGGNFIQSGDMSRIDEYGTKSICVNDAFLKKFCYCGEGIKELP